MPNHNPSRPHKKVLSPFPGLPFSKAIVYGDLVFVSGLVGRHPETGEIARDDIAGQTKQALENVLQQLELAGIDMAHVLKATIFITDMNLFAAMNEVYRNFFPADPPARSCVQVVALPDKEALVEIEVVAGR